MKAAAHTCYCIHCFFLTFLISASTHSQGHVFNKRKIIEENTLEIERKEKKNENEEEHTKVLNKMGKEQHAHAQDPSPTYTPERHSSSRAPACICLTVPLQRLSSSCSPLPLDPVT